jgi:hypothetical protein
VTTPKSNRKLFIVANSIFGAVGRTISAADSRPGIFAVYGECVKKSAAEQLKKGNAMLDMLDFPRFRPQPRQPERLLNRYRV